MNGKATCAILKQIRRDIAEKNDIALTIAECRHQGDCPGTCPRCEAEVRLLEKALAEKKKRGIRTAVAGISAGILAAGLVSCTPVGAENPQNAGRSGNGSGTEIAETVSSSVEVSVTDGELAPPEYTEAGYLDPDPDGGEALPSADNDPYGEEFPLEGEPPVTDHCSGDEDDGLQITAGLLSVGEYDLGDAPLTPGLEKEQP